MLSARRLYALLVVFLLSICLSAARAVTVSPVSPMEGFVEVNGVRLQYLDWGGSGPALILIPGSLDTPRVFDDIAPALTGKRHVISYTRRGAGSSDAKGPFDLETLTEDLHGLMDALGIARADLAGYSAGGFEITEMASRYPERVTRLIYLDSAYDWKNKLITPSPLPDYFDPPAAAMTSLSAFLMYRRNTYYPYLVHIAPLEADLRQQVVIQRDGSVKIRVSKELVNEYIEAHKKYDVSYDLVRCPVLALYAEHSADPSNDERGRALAAYEKQGWSQWQANSIDYVRQRIPGVQIARFPGGHGDFIVVSREQVIHLMLEFLN